MALRSDLEYRDIRGNVDTRLEKLRRGEYDAIVLAAAGLRRLHASARHTVAFDVREVVPAVGQGALAVETVADAPIIARLYEAVNDRETELAVTCERAALAKLHGGCQAPIGVHAFFDGGTLNVVGAMTDAPGGRMRRCDVRGAAPTLEDARSLGITLAEQLQCA